MKDLKEIATIYNIDEIEAWDIAYLSEKIKEKKIQIF
jgi:Zn-dependent oligopeptidase